MFLNSDCAIECCEPVATWAPCHQSLDAYEQLPCILKAPVSFCHKLGRKTQICALYFCPVSFDFSSLFSPVTFLDARRIDEYFRRRPAVLIEHYVRYVDGNCTVSTYNVHVDNALV